MTMSLDSILSSLKVQITQDLSNTRTLKKSLHDEKHCQVIKARQQGKRHFKLLRLMGLPLDQLLEAIHMDTPELCQKLGTDDMNDITLVRQVLESAERVANGDEIEIELTSLSVRCVYYLAPLI
jgi:hypothetical protein